MCCIRNGRLSTYISRRLYTLSAARGDASNLSKTVLLSQYQYQHVARNGQMEGPIPFGRNLATAIARKNRGRTHGFRPNAPCASFRPPRWNGVGCLDLQALERRSMERFFDVAPTPLGFGPTDESKSKRRKLKYRSERMQTNTVDSNAGH